MTTKIEWPMLCPDCKGEGFKWVNIRPCCSGYMCGCGGRDLADEEDCEKCQGTGWLDLADESEAA